MIKTIIFVWIAIALFFGGYIIGAVRWHEKGRDESPAVGYLKFNTNDPTKEFLELHITKDINIESPPEYVRLLILTDKEGGNSDGSKT